MSSSDPQVSVAILTFPETTASVTYGMYDLFMAVGRDWCFVVDDQPGPSLCHPLVASVQARPFTAVNGVRIEPQATLDECADAQSVCVPEISVPPEELGGDG